MKNKIGLVLAHHNTNYGALLQAFATQFVIDSLGYKTTIIDYKASRYNRGLKFDWGLIPYLWNAIKSKKAKKRLPSVVLDEIHLDNIEMRKKQWHDFEEKKLHDIHVCYGYSDLQEYAGNFDAILIGSDQLWLPGVSFGNYYSLRFVPNDVRKISYATSLGVSCYPKYCNNSARKMFRNIDYLSVREEQGKMLIQRLDESLKVNVVCDPTYLLSKKDWLDAIPYYKMSNEKYILCYFLGNSEKQMEYAKKYADFRKLKCFSILSDESINKIDSTFADSTIIGASVSDFVNYIRNAECIITDSFHGLAFSVINEKQFFIFYRKRDDAKDSRNSRIDNILKMWGIENRLISENSDINDASLIDYESVSKIVEQKREESLVFLKEALSFSHD